MVLRGLILVLGLAVLSAVVWGLEELQADLIVDALAVLGLYSGIFVVSNLGFMRDYNREIKARQGGK